MFSSPEQALSVAYAFEQLRIEPRNATAQIVDAMRARRGNHTDAHRIPSGLSQHEWHAQAAMLRKRVERELAGHPLLLLAVHAEYSHGLEGAAAIRALADHLAPDLTGRDKLLADALVMREFRGNTSERDIVSAFGVSKGHVHRRAKWWAAQVAPLRRQAIDVLIRVLDDSGAHSA